MRRRNFLSVLGGAAAWPIAARGQQNVRRVGVLMNFAPDDPAAQTRLTRFLKRMQELGWTDGRNLHIDMRWGAGSVRVGGAGARCHSNDW
jgi:putative ABC transport system substrate-binding protein